MQKKIMGIAILGMALVGQAHAIDKTATGAVLGATAGAIAGKSVKSTVGGAVVGAGAGAMLKKAIRAKRRVRVARLGRLSVRALRRRQAKAC